MPELINRLQYVVGNPSAWPEGFNPAISELIREAVTEIQQRRASVVTQEMVEAAARSFIGTIDEDVYLGDDRDLTSVTIDGTLDLSMALTAALSLSHETGDGEAEAALPDPDQISAANAAAWRSRPTGTLYWSYTELRPEGPSAHLFTVEAADRVIAGLNKQLTEQLELSTKYVAKFQTAEASLAAMRDALTPSGGTKAAYIGEFSISHEQWNVEGDDTETVQIAVPWTTIKEIMAAISARAIAAGENGR